MKIIKAKTVLREYPIYIGKKIFIDLIELILNNTGSPKKILLITNQKIFNLYSGIINQFLECINLETDKIILQDGEQFKSLDSAELIYSVLVKNNFHRNDLILAFGGGVIGDLSGYVAATYHRGIKLIHVPTTIIGQVDSSIGGKVAVNYKNIKNAIGTFYQPHMIIIDTSFLETLDEEQIINGLAEVLKYGIIFDTKIIKKIENILDLKNNNRLFGLVKSDLFIDIIYRCCRIKVKIAQKDEFDDNIRNLLNFGHTIGHCLENASDLTGITHGKAIAMGMMVAVEISIEEGLIDAGIKECLKIIYKKLKLPYSIPDIDIDKVMEALKFDKKFTSASNKFILIEGLNKPVFSFGIEKEIILNSINKCINKNI